MRFAASALRGQAVAPPRAERHPVSGTNTAQVFSRLLFQTDTGPLAMARRMLSNRHVAFSWNLSGFRPSELCPGSVAKGRRGIKRAEYVEHRQRDHSIPRGA